jgi:polyhydroxyalkanoate synthesis regulator phasin
MPQPRRSTGARQGGAKRASTRKPAARKPAARSTAKPAAKRTPAKSAAKPAARKAAAKSTRKPAAKRAAAKPARKAPAKRDDAVRQNVTTALEQLNKGVVLTREFIQEVLDDSVSRGRMTRGDANRLLADLLERGRKQTQDVVSDIEQLLGRGRAEIRSARRRAARNTAADRALKEVDKVRRSAGLGNFPILGFDDLTAAQVADRVAELTPAQLRKVRDYERRNANRKSVLQNIERKLG